MIAIAVTLCSGVRQSSSFVTNAEPAQLMKESFPGRKPRKGKEGAKKAHHFARSSRTGALMLCCTRLAVVPRNTSARKRWP